VKVRIVRKRNIEETVHCEAESILLSIIWRHSWPITWAAAIGTPLRLHARNPHLQLVVLHHLLLTKLLHHLPLQSPKGTEPLCMMTTTTMTSSCHWCRNTLASPVLQWPHLPKSSNNICRWCPLPCPTRECCPCLPMENLIPPPPWPFWTAWVPPSPVPCKHSHSSSDRKNHTIVMTIQMSWYLCRPTHHSPMQSFLLWLLPLILVGVTCSYYPLTAALRHVCSPFHAF